jgi:hypothetical protein
VPYEAGLVAVGYSVVAPLEPRRPVITHGHSIGTYRFVQSLKRHLAQFAWLPLAFSAPATSQSDLSVSTEYSGFNALFAGALIPPRPTSSGGSIMPSRPKTLRITARNVGPGIVADVAVRLFTGEDISNRIVATPSPGCTLTPTPPLHDAQWMIGAMAPGSERECTLTLRPAPGDRTSGGVLTALIAAADNTDPIDANNVGTLYEVPVSPVDYIRDMSLSIRSPQGILRPGVLYTIDFTLTNLGPGQQGDPQFPQTIYSELYRVGPAFGEYFALAYDGDPDCRYLVTDIGTARVSEIAFASLPPGNSRTCTMLLAVFPGGTGIRRLPFWSLGELPGVFDERLDNNIAEAVFQYSAPPVSIPFGTRATWVLLALLLGLLGAQSLRRFGHR